MIYFNYYKTEAFHLDSWSWPLKPLVITVKPLLSDHPKCQVKVVAYENLDHNGSEFSSLEYGDCRVLPNTAMSIQCLTDVKVNFEKKIRFVP